ncbi:2Fe-2S iron-sulfur cluster-binding protein [Candidatus Bipolaricaulota bacterium]
MEKTVSIRVSRFDPGTDEASRHDSYDVPVVKGMSVMDALDYIYENLDGTLAYYDHAACNQGICKRCLIQINGETGMMCQTLVTGDITLDPLPQFEVIKDLVTARGGASHD